jgi:hypothetical protein
MSDEQTPSRLTHNAVGKPRHPSIAGVLKHFRFEHLPEHLKAVSSPCYALAVTLADALPEDPETTAGLRKLLEAKDCFVRARLG